jgi:hypothetical protein
MAAQSDDCFPTNFKEWTGLLKTSCSPTGQDDCCATMLCLPVKLPVVLIGWLPCTCYNVLRNSCAKSESEKKNYLC